MTTPAALRIDGSVRLRLARGVRLHRDEVRGQTVLLAPERAMALDDIAQRIVAALDGQRTLDAVVDGFAEALAEHGLTEAPLTGVTVDHSIEAIRARTAEMMRRKVRPDGIVSGAGAATFALVAGIEDAGFRLGSDIDIVSKQASRLLHLLRPQIHVVNENVRLAGSELARAVMARIAGKPVASLQSLSRPDAVEAFGQDG